MQPVDSYIKYFIKIWENSSKNMPVFDRVYTATEQQQREQNYEHFQQKIQALQSRKNARSMKRADPGKSFFPVFKAFLENVFDFRQEQLEIILSDQFKGVSKDFYYKARAFGPELSPENIYQGMRNVWIMNGIQLIMNLPVEITPSVFAYSMIYPYSDNLLDETSLSTKEKKEFSERFNHRLHGESVKPQTHAESQLFRLVGMFEKQFPRANFPGVYNSLYAIQTGQTNSLKLIGSKNLSNYEIKSICFEKGGASVLADGYLVAGNLTPDQELALFGYGVYLQLLDDIQDVKEDSEAQTHTLFSCTNRIHLDEFVNQTINFGRTVMKELLCFDNQNTRQFLPLMNRSIETMIIESAGLNPIHYSEEWMNRLEMNSPLRFEFIRKKRSQSKSQRFTLFQKYFKQQQREVVNF